MRPADAEPTPLHASAADQSPELRPWSIRRRMLGIALGVALLAWLVGGVAAYLADQQADAQLRDGRLAHLAETLAALSEHELGEQAADAPGAEGHGTVRLERDVLGGRYLFQVWRADGRLVLRSRSAPADVPLIARAEPGFGASVQGGDRLRTYLMRSRGGGGPDALEIHVAERLDPAENNFATLGAGLVAAMLLSMGAVALLAGWLVVRALRPMGVIEAALRGRQPADVAPLPAHDVPEEMRPMLAALNGLIRRGGERLSRERGFTALAAHELRMPLATLRLRAQVALRETDPDKRAAQLAALLPVVDRCDHLIAQLLTLARLEQDERAEAPEPVDLRALADELLDELEPMAAKRRVRTVLELDAPQLRGRRFGLQMLLRNLVVNALRHSPEGGTVRIASRHEPGATLIEVDDAGPGIAPADRERVFERFVRLDRDAAGVGLGLSIVRAVAEAHGASTALLEAPGGGLRVRVSFPDGPGPAGSPGPAP
ncbi:ATP-binding protein [Aquabacterium humicola]|uniref:ATP-binding protein n=1 Tax=Aquabacterium humicola TaxID=3237377 RepID=UPI002543C2A9|nr:ATP-binding protein [Rubrivivax pictus]